MLLLRQSFRLGSLTITFRETSSFIVTSRNNSSKKSSRLYCSAAAIPHPTPEGCEKMYPPKIKNIVEEIAKLTLIEVSDLNECLKKTLNIKDVPMGMGMMAVAATASPAEEEAEPVETKTSFDVKLVSIDPSKKVAVIKEIKNQIDGMNLVQAKKFVESVPQLIKTDIGKDDAEKIKQVLEAAGGVCEIS